MCFSEFLFVSGTAPEWAHVAAAISQDFRRFCLRDSPRSSPIRKAAVNESPAPTVSIHVRRDSILGDSIIRRDQYGSVFTACQNNYVEIAKFKQALQHHVLPAGLADATRRANLNQFIVTEFQNTGELNRVTNHLSIKERWPQIDVENARNSLQASSRLDSFDEL